MCTGSNSSVFTSFAISTVCNGDRVPLTETRATGHGLRFVLESLSCPEGLKLEFIARYVMLFTLVFVLLIFFPIWEGPSLTSTVDPSLSYVGRYD